MILFYIYLIISVLCFILYTLAPIEIARKFKLKHPDLKYPKSSFIGHVFAFIKVLVASCIPLMNIALLWVMVFDYSTLETKTFNKLYLECMEYNEKE